MDFVGEQHPIAPDLALRMRGVSWHHELPGGFRPPPFEALRLLRLTHWDFAGRRQHGELVVAAAVASDVLEVFEAIYAARFPIARMEPIENYAGDDDRSMAANNSSGFNCRLIAGSAHPSKHATGLAIDINPVQNPYVVGERIHPEAARAYLDRGRRRPGMLFRDGPVVTAFARVGWTWGGLWEHPKDYHHFERADGDPRA